MDFDVQKIRQDFPVLNQTVNGYPLAYLDNAATTQKPIQVIEAVADFYKNKNANIHRGAHYLSNLSTDLYEQSRQTVQKYINAAHDHEIIFTKGTTEGLNLIASTLGEMLINQGDEIIISIMEHHANLVPWQQLAIRKQAKLKVVPLTDDFQLDFEAYKKLFTEKTKLVAITHVSNSLGTINPIKDYIEVAHQHNVPIIIDTAQSIQHEKIDVQALDCDFLVFSGHKIYAETGIGVVYGKEKWLEQIPPYQFGGDMIKDVTIEKTIFADLPLKFEAGTTNYVGAYSLKVAIDYLQSIGLENIKNYEKQLLNYAIEQISQIDGVEYYATKADNKISVLSFNIKGAHPYDVGLILDQMGVAIRTGKHCTHPLMYALNLQNGTARASFAMYNTFQEVDQFIEAVKKAKQMLS